MEAATKISLVLSVVAVLVSLLTAWAAHRQRHRQERAAVTANLYPVLRALRDNAQQFGKPLGGGTNEQLIGVHYAVIDLSDLTPAISDGQLKGDCEALLAHPASDIAISIDPPRLASIMLADHAISEFNRLAEDAQEAVQRCQSLRRGAA